MAKKQLIWKRNTNDNAQMVQTTLSKLSSNDLENLYLEIVPTVEHTVEHPVESTVESPVNPIVEPAVKQTVSTTKQSILSVSSTDNPTIIENKVLSMENISLAEKSLELQSRKEISNNRQLVPDTQKEQDYINILAKVDENLLSELKGTHTETEHRLYLVMYCESRKHNSKDRYFSGIELARLLGLKHRRNIMNVLQKLEMKKCISTITSSPGQVLGKEYRIYEPEEIIERRKKSKMRIHPQTKKIV